jgi:hypothetical protein
MPLSIVKGQNVNRMVIPNDGVPSVTIQVVDAVTGLQIIGAHVRLLSASGDTLLAATDERGMAVFKRNIRSDSLVFTITGVGYKVLSRTLSVVTLPVYLRAQMVEEIIEMNTIIVRGDRIAMVVKGDTVVYNASAFKTMRGDPLQELVKKLPGMVSRNGRYYVNGEPIHMILIKGTELFGQNISAAVEMIRSDEVVNVKSYNYYSQEEKEKGDTLERAKRVLDVTTREKITVVERRLLSGATGMFTGNKDWMDNELASYHRMALSKQAIVLFNRGRNASGNVPTQQATRQLDASMAFTDNMRDQLPYSFMSKYTHRRVIDRYNETGIHSATSTAGERQTSLTRFSKNYNMSIPVSGSLLYKIGKRDRLMFIFNGEFTRLRDDQTNASRVETATLRSSTDTRMHTNNQGINNQLLLDWSHNFKRPGRAFSMIMAYTRTDSDDTAWQVDTTATSIERSWLTREATTHGNQYSLTLKYSTKVRERLSVNIDYNIKDSRLTSVQEGFNHLSGYADTLTTHNYTSRDQVHQLINSILFIKGKWRVVGGIIAQTAEQVRDERSYPANYLSRRFNNVLLNVNASYTAPVSQWKIIYKENIRTLSTNDLRDVIDRSNPLRVTVGNPQLKQGVERTINIEGHLIAVKSASSWSFKANASTISNQIATRKYFFTRDSLLTTYNYLMKAGSSLEIKENVDGQRTLGGELTYSNNLSFLESTVSATIAHHYERSPYFNMNQLEVTRVNRTTLSADVQTAFSRLVQFSLHSETAWEHSSNDKSSLRSVRENLTGDTRINFARRFWIKVDGRFSLFDPSMPGAFYREFVLNSSFSYKFGKRDAGEVALHMHDMLNSQKLMKVAMTDDYTSSRITGILGRSAYISLQYMF